MYLDINTILADGVTVHTANFRKWLEVKLGLTITSTLTDVAIGANTLTVEGTDGSNVAVGTGAARYLTKTAGQPLQRGTGNTAIGSGALGDAGATCDYITAVGYQSLNKNTTGYSNTGCGIRTLGNNTTGTYNSAFGVDALLTNVIGNNNTAGGAKALLYNTGNNNTAFGTSALQANTSGIENTAVGPLAGLNQTTASRNTYTGYRAGDLNISGTDNTGSGWWSLRSNTGSRNTAHGSAALLNNGTGTDNTAIGENAARNNGSGSNVTGLGRNTLVSAITYSNVTGVGANADVTGSNQVQLGDSATTTYAYGAVQNRSDIRDKTDINPSTLGLAFINALVPVDYRYDYREDYRAEGARLGDVVRDGSFARKRRHHGFVAQHVKRATDELGVSFGGFQDHAMGGGDDVMSLGYTEFIAPMVRAIQDLSEIVFYQQRQIDQILSKPAPAEIETLIGAATRALAARTPI